MPSSDHAGLVPSFNIKVNGSALPEAAKADVLALDIYDDLDAPSMFTLLLNNWDAKKLTMSWSDDKLFAEGGAVEIQLGYVDKLTKIFDGEITGLELEFEASSPPRLLVRGHDRRHRLMRGHKTRAFVKKKDSEIASQIANEDGLSCTAEDTSIKLDYVLQHNQTDLEFLQERAARIGYEVAMDAKKLLFRVPQHSQSASVTLKRETDVIEFFPRLVTLNQVEKVEVLGWNPTDKKAITSTAQSPNGTMGATSGPQASKKAFGASISRWVDQPVLSKAEADKVAMGQLNAHALAYIAGDGLCLGNPQLGAGKTIQIEGMGTRFSGSYYVTAARHSYRSQSGYRTGFTVKRNAAG